MHNTVFGPKFQAFSGPAGLHAPKLLYIVDFSALVANLANVAMHNTRCPVATIHTGIVSILAKPWSRSSTVTPEIQNMMEYCFGYGWYDRSVYCTTKLVFPKPAWPQI